MVHRIPNPFRIIILGSGISGLSAAETVIKYSQVPCKVTLVECEPHVGGWLQSKVYEDGSVFEHGPRSARSIGDTALQALNIMSDIGIGSKIIGIPRNKITSTRYIYANGKMNELPSSISSMLFRQDPFSRSIISIIAKELFVEKNVTDEDESIYSFFCRRFNKEIADYLATSLCRGIFGGDANVLSMKSCFRQVFEFEKKYGSVTRGMFFSKSGNAESLSDLALKAKREKWTSWTVQNGMQALPKYWADSLRLNGVQILLDTKCEKLSFSNEKVFCTTNSCVLEADAVISSLPVCSLKSLLTEANSTLSALLGSINFATMAVVNLEYVNEKVPFNGFGFLVPSNQPLNILGMTFDSVVLPHPTQHNSAILTVMSGGAWFEEIFGNPNSCDENMIIESSVKNVRDILGFRSMPRRVLCKIQKNCIPQYYIGHDERVEQIKNFLKASDLPLLITGTSWGGVGINDAIINSKNDTLRWLASNHMY
ncbi:protoporphyrinogen oxidase isoform X1 [Hydra vulgaris]|uniref:Protoporphyrinogen oxidase n=2 Tax=Hydra vulgaris TaxID=6087 RepID=T2MEX5_HYDVU|nr:protoporphyrinogen oxidase isoform X1 [Hydra vulgaris]